MAWGFKSLIWFGLVWNIIGLAICSSFGFKLWLKWLSDYGDIFEMFIIYINYVIYAMKLYLLTQIILLSFSFQIITLLTIWFKLKLNCKTWLNDLTVFGSLELFGLRFKIPLGFVLMFHSLVLSEKPWNLMVVDFKPKHR